MKKNFEKLYKEKVKEIDRLRRWLEDFNTAYVDLDAKLKIALERLQTVSAGLHYSDEVKQLWTQDTKLVTTASMGLKTIALMRQREKPYWY